MPTATPVSESFFESRLPVVANLLAQSTRGSAEHDILAWYRAELEALRTDGIVRLETSDGEAWASPRLAAAVACLEHKTVDEMRARARAWEVESGNANSLAHRSLEVLIRRVSGSGRRRGRMLVRRRRLVELNAPTMMIEAETRMIAEQADLSGLTCGFDWTASLGRIPADGSTFECWPEAARKRLETLTELSARDVPGWVYSELMRAQEAGAVGVVARLGWSSQVSASDAKVLLETLGISAECLQSCQETIDVDASGVFEPIVGPLLVAAMLAHQNGVAFVSSGWALLLLRGEDALAALEARWAKISDAPLETWRRGVPGPHPVRVGMLELMPEGHWEISVEAVKAFHQESRRQVEAQRSAVAMELVRQERVTKLADAIAVVENAGARFPPLSAVLTREVEALRDLCLARSCGEPMFSPLDLRGRMLFAHLPPVDWSLRRAQKPLAPEPHPVLFDLLYLPPKDLGERLSRHDFSLWQPLIEGILEGAVPPAPQEFVRMLLASNPDPEHWARMAGTAGQVANMGGAMFARRTEEKFAQWLLANAATHLSPAELRRMRLDAIENRPEPSVLADVQALFQESLAGETDDDFCMRVALVWAARALEMGQWAEAEVAATKAMSMIATEDSPEDELLKQLFPRPAWMSGLPHRLLGAAALGSGRVDDAFAQFRLGFASGGSNVLSTKRFLNSFPEDPLNEALLEVGFLAQSASATDTTWRETIEGLARVHPEGDRIRSCQDKLLKSAK
jgi:hypothetical protein